MQNLITIAQGYQIFLLLFMLAYMMRHFIFTYDRLYGEQKNYYHDIIDNEFPMITVAIPMHNEALVARNILDRLLESDYPMDKMVIVPINDHSTDDTKEILDIYAEKYSNIHPYHRLDEAQRRGKADSLNDIMEEYRNRIVVVFDADYQPAKEAVRSLVVGFKDPQVGAVMGRVLAHNAEVNILTTLLDLERSGGYQVGQQARYNMDLIPQYGGTVGAYRHDVLVQMGSFDPKVLAEDTELTFKMYLHGWKVAYANKVECYEEVPEEWEVRARQVRRWARGHNEVMFRHLFGTLTSKYLSFKGKLDGVLLLFIYLMPVLLMLGIVNAIFLFFVDAISIVNSLTALALILAINAFGNFAPFFQVAIANYLDKRSDSLKLIPMFAFNFVLYIYYTSLGFFDSLTDIFTKRDVYWNKTKRSERGMK